MKRTALISLMILSVQVSLPAGQTLTLEECKQLAVTGNKELEQARQKTIMAGYDRKIALANYFPNISASGAYMHNSKSLSLISPERDLALKNMGTAVQGALTGEIQSLMASVLQNPAAVNEYLQSPMWQTVVGKLSTTDVSAALNALGSGISDILHPDISNVCAGVISIKQPVFMGGKIIASNQIARLASELSQTEYEEKCADVEMEVEKAYWTVVSLAAKDRLAAKYLDLLEHMCKDAEVSVAEGVAVQSDLLAIKVRKNEAQMLKTKTGNGTALAKMLLCKQLGLPLDSDIRLADEDDTVIPRESLVRKVNTDDVYAVRNETRMLNLASRIYDKKVAVVRADHLPKIAVTGNYLISNPNLYNGFSKSFDGMFNVGVMVSIPVFHATEGWQKINKAKTESAIYKLKYEEACNMVNLQLEQLYRQQDEAVEKLDMTESNLACAEENLRAAMLGFSEGAVSPNVALQAQTAWIKAGTEHIDAGIEALLNHSALLKAQGKYNK